MSKRGQEATSSGRFTDGETKSNDSGEGETRQLGVTQSVEHEENPPQNLGHAVDLENVDEGQGSPN